MGKRILIGSMLVLVMLLLMPSIPADYSDESPPESEDVFTFVCGRYEDISISDNFPKGSTIELTCNKDSLIYFNVGWSDHPFLGWSPYMILGRHFKWIYIEGFRGIITEHRIIGISFGESRYHVR